MKVLSGDLFYIGCQRSSHKGAGIQAETEWRRGPNCEIRSAEKLSGRKTISCKVLKAQTGSTKGEEEGQLAVCSE